MELQKKVNSTDSLSQITQNLGLLLFESHYKSLDSKV